MKLVDGVYLLDRTDYEQMGLEELRGQNEALRLKVASVSRHLTQNLDEHKRLRAEVHLWQADYHRERSRGVEWEKYAEQQNALLDKHRKRLRKLTAQVKALKAAAAEAKVPATVDAQDT